jgi:5-formyltetrahydrofolate cyclo-ligase|tara:strand:+ start:2422 stop:2994 length:573 start_codon:yes stop_codon:yes gene_type:complete
VNREKNNLRKQIKSERNNLSTDFLIKSSEEIIKQLNNNCKWDQMMVNIFLPIKKFKEIDLTLLIGYINSHGGQVCVNRSDFRSLEMTPILWDEKLKIKENEFGIPEPVKGTEVSISDIDIVLVPLLAFNEKGHRLGYGKGFYDRFLMKTSENCLFIGVNHHSKPIHFEGINEHDIRLHQLATPIRFREFI